MPASHGCEIGTARFRQSEYHMEIIINILIIGSLSVF